MTRTILFIIGCFFSSGTFAQEWFPIGASWYYNQVILLEGETYVHFQVTGDTVIQGINCSIISGSCNCGTGGIGNYFYQDGDRVYGYHAESDSFRIFYDFTLAAGDTIVYETGIEEAGDGLFLIDSVTVMQVGSQNLRVQHLTHLNFNVTWGSKIIERIGSTGCLYPQISFCDPSTGGLRCYEDDEIGLVNFQNPPRPCTYIYTNVEEPTEASLIKVYPNPATNNVHIQAQKSIEQISMFNNLGMQVFQQSSILDSEFDLEIHSIPGGVYRIQVVLNDDQVVHRSVVIQK